MSDDPNDDLGEEDELDMDESSFDEFDDEEKTLATLFRDNPMAKVGAIVVGIIVIFGIIALFSGSERQLGQSLVGTSSDITTPPGTQAASQEYIEAIQEVNERDVEIAQQTGGSALPTPIEPPVGTLTVPDAEAEAEDPLARWRRLQEERLERELQQAQTVEPTPLPADTGRGDAVSSLTGVFQQQMQAILDSRSNPINSIVLSSEEALEQELETLGNVGGAVGGGGDFVNSSGGQGGDFEEFEEEVVEDVLVLAGEIEFAQLLLEANSDIPGPVLAQVLSGPLNGSRILGSFSNQGKHLTLTFNTVVFNGDSIGINAVAVDPDTTLTGLATDVNNRYFQRIVLPAAAAFIEGAAEAIAESGRTTIVVDGDTVSESTVATNDEQEIASGIEELGEEIGEVIDDFSDVEVLVRIRAGTPMGILFLETVTPGNGDLATDDDAI